MSSSHKSYRSGFTLIELLVVIAIIAILAAILFPVFAKVREKARQVSCLSNMKQIGLAMAQYVQDFDEKFPSGHKDLFQGTNPGSWGQGWASEIYPYVKSAALYKCPDDQTGNYVDPVNSTHIAYPFSYVANQNLLAQKYNTPSPATLSQLESPVKTVFLCEMFGYTAYFLDDPAGDSSATTHGVGSTPQVTYALFETGYLGGRDASSGKAGYSSNQFKSPDGIHTGGANYLMADLHAKWSRGAQVSSGFGSAATPTADQTAPCTTGTYDPAHCAPAGVENNKYAATFGLL